MAFAKEGARVLIVDREEELGRATEAELRALGADAAFLPFDLVRHDALPEIVDAAIGRFGQLDILVNAAQLMPLADTTNDGGQTKAF